jgi:hypothetical protein
VELVVGSVYGFTKGEVCGVVVGKRVEVDGEGVV